MLRGRNRGEAWLRQGAAKEILGSFNRDSARDSARETAARWDLLPEPEPLPAVLSDADKGKV